MKNKFFLLGLIVALFAVSTPAFADPDPGGITVQAFVSTPILDQFASADSSAGLFVSHSIKSVLQSIAGGVAAIVGTILVLMLLAPMVKPAVNSEKSRDKDRPNLFTRLVKRTKSPVLKGQPSAA